MRRILLTGAAVYLLLAVGTRIAEALGVGGVAPQKCAQMGRVLFGCHGEREHRKRLFDAVDKLADTVGMPRSMKDAAVLETDFLPAPPEVTMAAYSDVTRRTNPRMPMLAEIEQMLPAAF